MENEKEVTREVAEKEVTQAVSEATQDVEKKVKKPMKKGVKVLMWILIVLALIGLCLGLGALYLKREGVKKYFQMPEDPARESVVELPEGEDALLSFATDLYAETTKADDVEGSWSTAVNLAGELTTPFKPADQMFASLIRDSAAGQIAPLYPGAGGVLWSEAETVPELPLGKAELLSAEGTEEGDVYTLNFDLDPASIDVEAMKQSDVCAKIADLFASAATVETIDIAPQAYNVRFKVDRTNGHLNTVEITRSFRVTAAVALTETYRALTEDGKAEISVPYLTTQTISFNYYGLSFSKRQIVMRPGDEEYMPVSLNLRPGATDDDFKVTVTCSDPDALEADDDGLLIAKHATDEPVTVTAVMEYNGHTYTDTLIVHLTDMELEATTNG